MAAAARKYELKLCTWDSGRGSKCGWHTALTHGAVALRLLPLAAHWRPAACVQQPLLTEAHRQPDDRELGYSLGRLAWPGRPFRAGYGAAPPPERR